MRKHTGCYLTKSETSTTRFTKENWQAHQLAAIAYQDEPDVPDNICQKLVSIQKISPPSKEQKK